MATLETWESRFRGDIERIDESKRQEAGGLLPVIPNHEELERISRLDENVLEESGRRFSVLSTHPLRRLSLL